MSPWFVLFVSLVYLGLLFAIAWRGDRRAPPAAGTRYGNLLYCLSLGVFCTSWTFYGAVGTAAMAGWDFLSIYTGPILLFTVGSPIITKIIRIAKQQNSVSIADFMAARYGKSQSVAATVTIVAVLGLTPYLALQLKAITASFNILTAFEPDTPLLPLTAGNSTDTALYLAGAMALFAILFGMRTINASEHHRGLMQAIAFESVIKLLAALSVGIAITFFLGDGGPMRFLRDTGTVPAVSSPFLSFNPATFLSITFLSFFGIICLPRQFHVTIVENTDVSGVRLAAWAFPAYLVGMNLFVVPIALAGLAEFGSAATADTFMVTIPLVKGAGFLALFSFLGGLSAGSSMIIVGSLALSTMISNDLIAPILIRRQTHQTNIGSLAPKLLRVRRLSVIAVLALAYAYNRLIGPAYPLSAIGTVSFAAVAQFGPALLLGLFWRTGHRNGALAGIGAGFLVWFYTLVLPSFVAAGWVSRDLLQDGPWHLAWLRPEHLFGQTVLDPVTHASLWSLGINLVCYVIVSLLSHPTRNDRRQANAFFFAASPRLNAKTMPADSHVTVGDLKRLASAFIGTERADTLYALYLGETAKDRPTKTLPDAYLEQASLHCLRFTERLVAGAIGTASAKIIVASALNHSTITKADAIVMLDQASRAIRVNHALLTATLENISQGICVFDENLRLRAWNSRFIILNDLPPDLVRVGTALTEIVRFNAARGEYGKDARIGNMLDRRFGAFERTLDIYERHRPDGTILEVATNPMPDGGFVATFTDVTERHRAAAALRAANEGLEQRVLERTEALASAKADAERANQSKTRFLAAASHDLLQPLHAARLFTSALADRTVDPLVGKIDTSLRSVETLLGSLLDVSKLDSGATRVDIGCFPLDDLLDTLCAEFEAIAEERGLGFTLVPTRLAVQSDPALLRRILQNFVSNAIRYTPEGRVLVGCRRRGDRLRIEIHDTGIGIPADKRDDVFLEFKRFAPETQGSEKSLGLGLAIVDRIARLLGHPIDVASTEGKGSCFAVTVPLAPRPQEMPPAELSKRARGLKDARILCLDNEPAILDGMRALLGGWGCDVRIASSEIEAEAHLNDAIPDILIVDYHLDHGETGLTALNALASILGHHPVATLVLTADHTDETKRRISAAGHEILYKPIRPAALRAMLGRMMQVREGG